MMCLLPLVHLHEVHVLREGKRLPGGGGVTVAFTFCNAILS
jgi:hypothetical protein